MTSSFENSVREMCGWLKEKKATDIVAMDVRGISDITDVVIVATGLSVRQCRALADFFIRNLAEKGMDYLGMEGQSVGNWILIDCNDVMVHLFLDETREFYNIEGLFSRAPRIEPDEASQE